MVALGRRRSSKPHMRGDGPAKGDEHMDIME